MKEIIEFCQTPKKPREVARAFPNLLPSGVKIIALREELLKMGLSQSKGGKVVAPGTSYSDSFKSFKEEQKREDREMEKSFNAIKKQNGLTFCKGGCCQGKLLLVLNPPEKVVEGKSAGRKSRENCAIYGLKGLRGKIQFNRKNTCVVVNVGEGDPIRVGTSSELGMTNDELNSLAVKGKAWWFKTTNGGGQPSSWVLN